MRTVHCIALACLIASPASAQTADRLMLNVSRPELHVIGQGLMELPYKVAAPILNDLQAQLAKADKAVADAAHQHDGTDKTVVPAKPEETPAR